MVDLEQIHLTKDEMRILRRVYDEKWVSLEDAQQLRYFGLVRYEDFDDKERVLCDITPKGVRYIEYCKDEKSDKLWERWLAIIAIIISLIALTLELDDRGMLGGLLEGFRTNPSSRQYAEQSLSD